MVGPVTSAKMVRLSFLTKREHVMIRQELLLLIGAPKLPSL